MNLTVKVIGSRVKPGTYNYATPQTEDYVVADVSIDGSTVYVAAALHALANTIDPNGDHA